MSRLTLYAEEVATVIKSPISGKCECESSFMKT